MLEVNKIHLGDNLALLKQMSDNSVDSVVTDPPYGINFMGKKWDYDVPSVETWQEVLRVLKPGGHALVACGTRTQHRMAVNIEDAGFEIRDIVAWVYGSGFPKSLDISKALDKMMGAERTKKIEKVRNPKTTGNGHDGTKGATRPFIEKALKENGGLYEIDDDIPVSDQAKQWQGWGTALKPAVEYWSLVQKPFTSVPFDDIIELDGKVGIILCQLLNVKYAEKNLTLNHQDCKEGFVSALMIAVETYIKEKQEKKEKTDIFKSQEMEKMFLNIVLLWNNILAELYQETNKYTTSMSEKMITELKILNLYLQANIYQNITQAYKTKTNGNSQNVWNVVKSLCVSKIPIGDIQILIAQENVSKKEIKNVIEKLVLFAVKFSIPEEIINIVQDNVQANQELSPNMELWTLCRKPLKGTVAENVLKYGTGGINVDGCRVGDDIIPAQERGNSVVTDFMSGGFTAEHHGRFPANFIHDGSEEVVKMFPNTNPTKPHGGDEQPLDTQNMGWGFKRMASTLEDNGGSAARFFYTAKANKTERDMGLYFNEEERRADRNKDDGVGGDNPRNRTNNPRKNFHPTVKPLDLMRYLCRLITPPNGIVLDPYIGSGTTAVAAKLEGFRYIGMEQEPDYVDIANGRVAECDRDYETKAEILADANVKEVFDIFDFMKE